MRSLPNLRSYFFLFCSVLFCSLFLSNAWQYVVVVVIVIVDDDDVSV